MEKQDLKNLLENIYHLLAEEDTVPTGPGMLDPNWSPLEPPGPWWTDGPEPTWESPLGPDRVVPRVDPILNPEGPGGGTLEIRDGRRFYVFPNGQQWIWNESMDPPRWLIYRYPMLGDPNLPFPSGERLPGQALGGELWPTWLGGLHTPEEWLEIINRSPWFSPNSPNSPNP